MCSGAGAGAGVGARFGRGRRVWAVGRAGSSELQGDEVKRSPVVEGRMGRLMLRV